MLNSKTAFIKQLTKRWANQNQRQATLFAGAFAVVGVLAVVLTHAATTATGVEAEAGTATAAAGSITDSTASGSKAVKFGSGSTGTTPTPNVTLAVNGATKYQTITGLGASINVHSWDNGALKPVLDQLIGQGTKTFRVVMEMADWESTNDDSDPNNYNWAYYDPIYSGATSYDTDIVGSNFGDLWNTIDYLHAEGIPDSQIILSFMGDGPTWIAARGGQMAASKEDEWAETVVSAAYYGYSHGHTFGMFSPNNEEDIARHEGIGMTAAIYAASMNKVATRLDALGMSSVRLVGPETSDTLSSYVSALAGYPNVLSKLDHFDFHNYSGSTDNALSVISGYPGKDFWMSEYSQFEHSWNLLDQQSSGLLMWEAYDSVYNHAVLNGLGTAPGNDIDAGHPGWIAYDANTKVYTPRKMFYQFGQLFKWTPLGTQMVDAQTSKSTLEAEAFVHPTSGVITIVGENTSSSTAVIGGTLKNAPTTNVLHYTFTNASNNMATGSDVTVTAGGTFTASVPANTVFTLTTMQ